MAIERLASDINTLRTSKPRYFKQWLENADEEEKTLVMEAILDNTVPSNQLATLLTKKYDIPVTRATIEAYRDSSR